MDPSIHRPGLKALKYAWRRRALLINAVGHGLKRQCLCHTKNLKAIPGDLGKAVSSPLKPAYRGKDYSLGASTKQDEEEAELALKSDYFLTGDRRKGQRNQIAVMRFLSHAQEYSAIIYCAIALMMRRDASTVLA